MNSPLASGLNARIGVCIGNKKLALWILTCGTWDVAETSKQDC
jgi:hypothetical protein